MEIYLFNTAHSNFVKELSLFSLHADGKRPNVSKSYTKSAMALCISHTTEIGIDLEEKKRRSQEAIDHFIKKFCTFQIRNIPPVADEQWFYRAWTAMESYFKLVGMGFSTPKDFTLDMEKQLVLRDGKVVAYLGYFDIGNYLLCFCSKIKFSEKDVQLYYHGWENLR